MINAPPSHWPRNLALLTAPDAEEACAGPYYGQLRCGHCLRCRPRNLPRSGWVALVPHNRMNVIAGGPWAHFLTDALLWPARRKHVEVGCAHGLL